MNRLMTITYLIGLLMALSVGTANAIDPEDGVKRMGDGVVDAVTSPGEIVEGISEDTKEHGAVVGTVTGTAKGTVKAAGKVVEGGAKIGVGAVETAAGVVDKLIVEPLTGE